MKRLHFLVLSLSLAAGNSPEEVNCGNSAIEEMLRTHSSHSCEPRRVIVEVKGDWRRLNLLAPSHVEVLRCVGSCGHYHHSCLPLEVSTRTVPTIMSEPSTEPGVRETVCGDVKVEDHLRCGCGCQLTGKNCSSNQEFLPYECRCACTNHHLRDDCLARGWNWDRKTCACTCPNLPYPTCPNNLMFDYLHTCSCIPTHNQATLQIISFFVLLICLVLVSIFSVAKYCLIKKNKLRNPSQIFTLNPSGNHVDIRSLPHNRELIDLLHDGT